MTRMLPTKNPLLCPRIGRYIYQLFRISITFSRRDHQAEFPFLKYESQMS